MDANSSGFRDSLLELIDTSPEPMEHPSPDQWLAYHRGELPDEEARLQEHLVRCRDCFDLAEAAAAFAQPDEETGTGQEVETAALWRLLRPQLDPRQSVQEISASPRPRRSREARVLYALAASFFVALVGLIAWNLTQKSQRAVPVPNAPIIDFFDGQRLAAPSGSGERVWNVATGSSMLVFHPGEDLPAYRLGLRDLATGRELGPYELTLDTDSALTLQLPEGLRPGRYRLELSDGSGGRTGRVLKRYLLNVTEPDRGE